MGRYQNLRASQLRKFLSGIRETGCASTHCCGIWRDLPLLYDFQKYMRSHEKLHVSGLRSIKEGGQEVIVFRFSEGQP